MRRTYEDVEDAALRVTRKEAERELARHDWTWASLKRETGTEPAPGDDGMYAGTDVLDWLGY